MQTIKLITAPVVEPVTLAQTKDFLHISGGTIGDALTTTQTIAPGSHAIVPAFGLVGSAVDVLGAAAVLVILEAGTFAGTADVKIQHSADNLTWADWTGGAFAQVAAANDLATYEKVYTGGLRYIRAVATVAAGACEFGVSVVAQAALTAEDATISFLITSAREWAEAKTGRALCLQTRELILDAWPDVIKVLCAPLLSAVSLTYTDCAGTAAVWAAANYLSDLDSVPARVRPAYGLCWPSVVLQEQAGIRLRFTAGYSAGDAAAQQAAVPSKLKETMLRRIRWQFDHRDPAEDLMQSRSSPMNVPLEVDNALERELSEFRIWSF
jgi:uncharacterized phiE125 gp8 family phage protein